MTQDLIIQINSFLFYWGKLEDVDSQIKARKKVISEKYLPNKDNIIIKSLKSEKDRLVLKMAKSINFAIKELDYVKYSEREAEHYEQLFKTISNKSFINKAEKVFSNNKSIDLDYLKFFKWQIDSFYDAMSIYCEKSYGRQIDDIV